MGSNGLAVGSMMSRGTSRIVVVVGMVDETGQGGNG